MQCDMNGRDTVARAFGRMYSRMWEPDGAFVTLTGLEQRLYQFLNSQADLTHAGTLPITLRRWAKAAKDLTPKHVEQQLRALEDAGFLVVDFDEEELLVCRHMLDDEVYKQPRVMGSAVASAMRIRSRKIRRAVALEIEEIVTEDLNDAPGKGGAPSVREQVESHIIALRVALRADLPADAPLQRHAQGAGQQPAQPPAEPLPKPPAQDHWHPLPEGADEPPAQPPAEGAALGVAEGDQQGSPTGIGMVSTRVRAPLKLETRNSSSSSPNDLIRAARVVEEDEEDQFLAWIRKTHQPGSGAWWRTVAENGDFPALADAWRATRTQTGSCLIHRIELPCRGCAADAKADPDEWPPREPDPFDEPPY